MTQRLKQIVSAVASVVEKLLGRQSFDDEVCSHALYLWRLYIRLSSSS